MYKLDLETLNEITATLDAFLDVPQIAYNGIDVVKGIDLRIKSRKLSQKIKEMYLEKKN